MSRTPIYSALAALALLSVGCSREEAPDQPTRQPQRAPLMLTIATGDAADGTAQAGTPAERYIDDSRLFIATYKETGEFIESIYVGAPIDNGDGLYSKMNPPTIAFHLNHETHTEYKGTFYIVAYAVPNNTENGTAFSYINNALSGNYELKWPGNGSTPWAPVTPAENATDGPDNFIPMAGYVKVTRDDTQDDLEGYDPYMNTISPFPLPKPIRMTRAMAKVVIEDPDGIIAQADFKTQTNGFLIPAHKENEWWSYEGQITAPKASAVAPSLTQSLTTANASRTENSLVIPQFVFYSYEFDFTKAAADASERKIINLTAKTEANLSKPTHAISIAPYAEGELASATAEELKTRDNGDWSGLLRNHIYTFTVTKPGTGGVEIYVKSAVWEKEPKQEFEF